MYRSSDLDSLLTSDYSSSVSPASCSCPFPSTSLKDNQTRLVLNKNATSYAILTASSDAVFSTDSINGLWAINGSVNLVLGDVEDIHSVVISILGQIVTRADATKHITFLDITKTLWSRKRDINYPHNNSQINKNQKLSGDHHWPFSIPLPKKVLLPNRRKHETEFYSLPESFHERNIRASVQYSLHLRLTRGKFKADDKLRIALTCPPVTPQPNPFRRQSLCSGLFLLQGPHEDPEAWYTKRGVVSGRLDHLHLVNVKYTLSLTKPLLYARGSVIPFSLSIEANNEGVLDVLSSPEAPVLRLRRCVMCGNGISSRFQTVKKREAI
ncbi:hypothetical protein E4T56_gene2313, partial [Termitomyces sp. T112]